MLEVESGSFEFAAGRGLGKFLAKFLAESNLHLFEPVQLLL
jgi:hypothetical protein